MNVGYSVEKTWYKRYVKYANNVFEVNRAVAKCTEHAIFARFKEIHLKKVSAQCCTSLHSSNNSSRVDTNNRIIRIILIL